MNYVSFVRKSAFRNVFRTVLTVLGIAVAVLAFLFLRTVVYVWDEGVQAAAQDRLAVRNKMGITQSLPRTYFEKLQVPGVNAATFATWFGGVNPQDEHNFFANFAVDSATYLQVYNEIVVPPEQLKAYLEDPKGAVIGETLAARYNWKVGDVITLRGTIYPGDWQFNIRAIYTTTSHAFDKMTLMFHWKYLNEGVTQAMKEQVSWFGVQVKDPSQGPQVSQAIDNIFEPSDFQTLTESERAFNLSFISMYAGVFTAMDVVSIIILLIMTLLVGNTIAMNVRDRTNEYGVLRAIGFKPKHLGWFVVGETTVLAAVGAAVGVGLAVPIINAFGVVIVENAGQFFPFFSVSPVAVVAAVALALGLGLAAGALPAFRAARVPVTQALRRIG